MSLETRADLASSHIPPTSREKRLGLLSLFAGALLYAGFWVVARHGIIVSQMQPADLIAVRFTVAGLILMPYLMRVGFGVKWWQAIALTLGGGVLNSLLSIMGLMYAPAAHGATLMPGLAPIFTALITWLILDEEIAPLRWLGIATLVAGAFLLGSEDLGSSASQIGLGHLCFVGAAILWAFFAVLMRAWKVKPMQGTAIIVFLSMVAYVPVYSFIYGDRILQYPLYDIAFQGIYQGIFISVFAVYLFNRGIATFGAVTAGSAGALIPVFAVILSFVFLGELPSFAEFCGIVIVAAALPVAMGVRFTPDSLRLQQPDLGKKVDTRA